VKQAMPLPLGIAACLLHPLSGLASLASIAWMQDSTLKWPALLPGAIPLLFGAYVAGAFGLSRRPSSWNMSVGLFTFALVFALSISIIPGMARLWRSHADAAISSDDPR